MRSEADELGREAAAALVGHDAGGRVQAHDADGRHPEQRLAAIHHQVEDAVDLEGRADRTVLTSSSAWYWAALRVASSKSRACSSATAACVAKSVRVERSSSVNGGAPGPRPAVITPSGRSPAIRGAASSRLVNGTNSAIAWGELG